MQHYKRKKLYILNLSTITFSVNLVYLELNIYSLVILEVNFIELYII